MREYLIGVRDASKNTVTCLHIKADSWERALSQAVSLYMGWMFEILAVDGRPFPKTEVLYV